MNITRSNEELIKVTVASRAIAEALEIEFTEVLEALNNSGVITTDEMLALKIVDRFKLADQ